MRKALVILCVLVMTMPALATINQAGNSTVTVKLTIVPYAYIEYQDDSYGIASSPEPDCEFSSTPGTDWWRSVATLPDSGIIGAYQHNASKGAATDGWAVGYYETADNATIFIKSNMDLDATLACSGDLTGTTTSATIPTWFTISVVGWDEVNNAYSTIGFRLGNEVDATPINAGWVNDGTPLYAGGPGGYGGDDPNGTGNNGNIVSTAGPIYFGGQGFMVTQDVFRMNVSPYTMDLNAPIGPGSFTLVARCKRVGTLDAADTYTATIAFSWVAGT